MPRPLLFLFTVIGFLGADGMTFTVNSELDISTCPITYFGQKYNRLYANFTTKDFVICFDGYYNPGAKGDCLVGPKVQNAQFSIYPKYPSIEQLVVRNVPTISSTMGCFLAFGIGSSALLYVVNFGSQTALMLQYVSSSLVVMDVQVTGNSVDTLNVTKTHTLDFSDASGCRLSGLGYKSGSVVTSDPKTCFSLTCTQTGLQNSTCGPLERCQGNGICIFDGICTVTGPTVIDVHGLVTSIEDRCVYSLLSIPSVPNFQVLANFQERRRKDVSFLDSVTLRLNGPGVQIQLKQGGRVLLGDSTLTLNSSAQLVYGVALSKDQTGVTAQVSLSNFTTSVFFDGYTAQIYLEGPSGSSLQGLCGNSSSSLSQVRLPQLSSPSCETQYNDTSDSTINCTLMTERCDLLKGAPFSSCGIDPAPYITACTDTLCEYPAVDDLPCHFLEAYARACSLWSNTTLGSWWSVVGCSPPQAFCQDQTCSDNEFCGEITAGGETRCFCRPIFASKYREINTLGDPAVCSQNSASLTLVGCLLEDKGIDYSVLHLNDPTCTGRVDQETHMVTFSFNSNSCGTRIMTNSSQITYKNTVMSQNSSSDIITRQDQVYIDFSCIQIQPDLQTVAFRIRDSSVVQVITSGPWKYTLTMQAYTDAGLTQAVDSSTEVQLNQEIWVELNTNGLDGNVVSVVTETCWATDQPSPSGSPRYDLIQNGCANPADQTVKVVGNGAGTSNYFSFNMFQFTESSGEVYLHCTLQLCVKQENSCIPVCNGARRRRSVRSRYEAAFISMAWTT